MMRLLLSLLLVCGLALTGIAQTADLQFQDVTTAAGITARSQEGWGAVAVGDYDLDGWDDLILSTHEVLRPPQQLYRNNRNGTFANLGNGMFSPGSPDTQHRHATIFCDIDQDGDEDVLVFTGFDIPTRNLWYRNNGGGTFTDIAQALGVADVGQNEYAATCADLDGDGRTDVLTSSAPMASARNRFRLWMGSGSNGAPAFVEDATARGLHQAANQAKRPWALDCVDFNGARQADCLETGNNASHWVLNQGFGRFLLTTGVYEPIANHTPYSHDGFWADFNGDGRLDAIIADSFNAAGNPAIRIACGNGSQQVLRNYADGLRDCWSSTTLRFGFEFLYTDSRALAVGDFDNDGWIDFALIHSEGAISQGVGQKTAEYLFRNNGTSPLSFQMSRLSTSITGTRFRGATVAVIDYDRDGRQDLLLGSDHSSVAAPFMLYRNVSTAGHWVGVILRGPRVLGSSVEITACGRAQRQVITARTGWIRQSTRDAHFGLGACGGPVNVTVRWPFGETTTTTLVVDAYRVVVGP